MTGAGHSTGAMFPESAFEINGTPSEYAFESVPGVVERRLYDFTALLLQVGIIKAKPGS